MTSPALITQTHPCGRCGVTLSLAEILKYGLGDERGGYCCIPCRMIFTVALAALEQGIERTVLDQAMGEVRCHECRRTLEQIIRDDGRSSLFVVFKDEGPQQLCGRCKDRFVRLSPEYRGTEYESREKIRGTKHDRVALPDLPLKKPA